MDAVVDPRYHPCVGRGLQQEETRTEVRSKPVVVGSEEGNPQLRPLADTATNVVTKTAHHAYQAIDPLSS